MATVRRDPAIVEEFECPSCGALKSEGGCRDSQKCMAELSRLETERTRQLVDALERSPSVGTRPLLAGMTALDHLGIGLAVCSEAGQLLFANRTAERTLHSRDGLEINQDGVMCAPLGASRPLGEILSQVARPDAGEESEKGSHALSVRRSGGRRALTLLVHRGSDRSWFGASAQAVALVLIIDGGLPVRTTEADLRQLYGFTTQEARLATLLMDGKTLDESSYELGISRSTACTHLKRLFKKTGVRRQSDLVSLLLKSIGLARLANSETGGALPPLVLKAAIYASNRGRAARVSHAG